MGRIEKTVFISYRRTNAIWALAIFKDLTHNGYDVFFDFDGIASGDFERVILENIQARAHFIVLLTPSALKACSQPGDWLRREIETALDMKRNIVSLMLEGFDFDSRGISRQLTGRMVTLRRYNALPVSVEYFDAAMSRLREKYLNVALDAVLHPVSESVKQVALGQQAAATAAPAVQEQELTAEQYFERGFEVSDLAERIRFYSQAIHLKPDFAEALNNRGLVRREQGDLVGARHDFDAALRLTPDDADLFYNRADLRAAQGDVGGAREDYDAAIRLKPSFAEALNNRGLLRWAQGDLPEARDDFDAALSLTPDDAEVFANRAVLRVEQGDLEGAREDYDAAISLKPDFGEALRNRGLLRRKQDDLPGARDDFDAAIRLKPDYAQAFRNRGNLRKQQGDVVGARDDFDAAIRLKPDYAQAFRNRGKLRKQQGDLAGAKDDLDTAIRLNPKLRES
jgi:tetratricopeptide (TPR) repeat protein